MTRHVSSENLARWACGDLTGGTARRVEAHLAGCAPCREASDAVAEVPALLAATEVPPMPAHLAARIEIALATESAQRAAGVPPDAARTPARRRLRPAPRHQAGPSARPGHPAHGRRTGRGLSFPGLPFPAPRVLAGAATVAVIAGGGYAVVSLLGRASPVTSSGASSASAGRPPPSAGQDRRPAFEGPAAPAFGTPPVYGPPVRYQAAGRAATIRPVRTSTNYQPAQLARQVAATLAQAPPAASHASTPASGQAAASFSSAQLTLLAGCLSRVAAGQTVLLANVASFRGAAATVIVAAAPGSAAEQVWVVGPGCSRSASHVLAHRVLPRY